MAIFPDEPRSAGPLLGPHLLFGKELLEIEPIFMGQMSFLPPNQQCQALKGTQSTDIYTHAFVTCTVVEHNALILDVAMAWPLPFFIHRTTADGFQSDCTHVNSHLAISYPSHFVPKTNLYPCLVVPKALT